MLEKISEDNFIIDIILFSHLCFFSTNQFPRIFQKELPFSEGFGSKNCSS
jgi:hypothetical protein